MSGEFWKPIDGFSFYDASDFGRVRSWVERVYAKGRQGPVRVRADTPKVLVPVRRSRYQNVNLYTDDGRMCTLPIHVLILETFVGPRPFPNAVACHAPDPDPTNNRLDNLRWGTRAENMHDAFRAGTAKPGRLGEADVPLIWEALVAGETIASIARRLGLPRQVIATIKNRVTWSHVTDKLPGTLPGRAEGDPVRAPQEILDSEEVLCQPVDGWPAYDVSSWGVVRSFWTDRHSHVIGTVGRPLTPVQSASGHLRVRLFNSPLDWRSLAIHRMVLGAFAGPCPIGFEACHDDGNPANNHIRNLRWDTRSSNRIDSYRAGTMRNAKLSAGDIPLIQGMLADGVSPREVGEAFGIGERTVRRIRCGENWSHAKDVH